MSKPGVKVQARESARARRAAESQLFKELEPLLGLTRYDRDSRTDKATIVRLATTFLKSKEMFSSLSPSKESPSVQGWGQDSLEGILLVFTEDLEIVSVSDNIYR